MAMDTRQSGLRRVIRPVAHMERDTRINQWVTGEFDTMGLEGMLNSQQRFHIGIRYTAFHFIPPKRRGTHTAPTRQVCSTPTEKCSCRFYLTNRYQLLSLYGIFYSN